MYVCMYVRTITALQLTPAELHYNVPQLKIHPAYQQINLFKQSVSLFLSQQFALSLATHSAMQLLFALSHEAAFLQHVLRD